MNRRDFLRDILVLGAAPAIVTASSLMRIRALRDITFPPCINNGQIVFPPVVDVNAIVDDLIKAHGWQSAPTLRFTWDAGYESRIVTLQYRGMTATAEPDTDFAVPTQWLIGIPVLD